MIVRIWGARSRAVNAGAYRRFFREVLRPQLDALAGFIDASVLERTLADDDVEILVLTRWASMEAITAFAGSDPARAVVEPEAQALLESFDTRVRHYSD